MSSKKVGSGLASLGALLFFYYSAWIFVTPFLDPSHWLHSIFIDRVWAVRIPQVLLASCIITLVFFLLFKSFYLRSPKVLLHPVN